MKQAVMKKWVRALRSGKFRRGRCLLKQKQRGQFHHCCLGVLCEVYQKETGSNLEDGADDIAGIYCFDSCESELPRVVQKWAGLKSRSGYIKIGKKDDKLQQLVKRITNDVDMTSLANLNDNDVSFNGIAGIIENNWRKL